MDTLFYFISQFAQDYVVFPIVIFGLLFLDRRVFLRIVVLLLFGIAINVLLKNIFQVPLNPELQKDWWAFPSGHAQLTATFYGYLAYTYRNPFFRILMVFIIIMECFALVHFRYHNWMDVFGALATAFVWIIVFEVLRKSSLFRDRFYVLALIFMSLAFVMESFCAKVPGVHQIVLGALVGVSVGLLADRFMSMGKLSPFIGILAVIGGAVVLYFGMIYLLASPIPTMIHLTRHIGILMLYAFPTFWIAYASGCIGRTRGLT